MSERYPLSEAYLKRAEAVIPLGSQTFSKSRTQLPVGISPLFAKRAKGSRFWDLDGREYVDFTNALAAIILGYGDSDVTDAVKAQLEDGVIFSLPHPIEAEVAELVRDVVPCAEKVRFGKNGSDATAGAIRISRAHTKRDHVLVCGYHGWQDWYIGSTTRNLGVPEATRNLTHSFPYNDLDAVRKLFAEFKDQVACVILEPMNTTAPKDGFHAELAELTRKNGALFVFDETITGFRYALGGAQEYFGVVPDLATFGKGASNGYPVSILAGKAEYMKWMEEVFFSSTFGGETLSLAAAKATITKMRREPVHETLRRQGTKILDGTRELLKRHGIEDVFGISGHPTWSFLVTKDLPNAPSFHQKTLFLQECFSRGIFSLGTHNLSYAHSDADVARLLGAYEEILPFIARAARGGTIEKELRCKPLVPLFKVR